MPDNPLVVGLIMPVIIIVLCIQGMGAIKKFFASPVWVQEAMIAAKY